MIDSGFLQKSGWSNDLIEAATRIAEEIDLQMQVVGSTEIHVHDTTIIEDTSTNDLSIESVSVSTWPTF